MGRNKIIHLNGDNYSELLNEFLDKFSMDFPNDYDTWEKLDFTMEVWNIANIKKLVPEDLFNESARLSEEIAEAGQLFNKMLDYKQKHYFKYEKFIVDYSFDLEVDPPKLEVITGDLGAYVDTVEEREFEEEEENKENLVNRNAIILKAKKPFEDWMDNCVSENFGDYIYGTKIYMIGEEVFVLEDWVKENFEDIFIRELETVSFEENDWPKNRTYSMFKKWFNIDFSTMVYDLENREITKGFFE